MPTAPEESSTEGDYVAATKARPATDEPVKRTAAKSPASAPAKRSPAKATNGAATKAAKAPAKAAAKTRTATKGAAEKAAPARGRPKKSTSKGADDTEATTTDVVTDEQDLDGDVEIDAVPDDVIELDAEDLNLEDLEVDAPDDAEDVAVKADGDEVAVKKPVVVTAAEAVEDEEIAEPTEKDKASGDFVWDEDESEALRQARKDAELTASADSVRAYLKQIGKVALLNAEEEVDLAKRIEAGLYSAERLRRKG
jgi:RNA polymerase primary sigma factor